MGLVNQLQQKKGSWSLTGRQRERERRETEKERERENTNQITLGKEE